MAQQQITFKSTFFKFLSYCNYSPYSTYNLQVAKPQNITKCNTAKFFINTTYSEPIK